MALVLAPWCWHRCSAHPGVLTVCAGVFTAHAGVHVYLLELGPGDQPGAQAIQVPEGLVSRFGSWSTSASDPIEDVRTDGALQVAPPSTERVTTMSRSFPIDPPISWLEAQYRRFVRREQA